MVPHNRFNQLQIPALGAWTPERRVSVVIPHFQAPELLTRTLAALAEQTYPHELLDVVVVDDGSDPPLKLAERLFGLDLTVRRQQRRGFGAPRARNLGADTASGDVLVFLDCDMLPEPGMVEAHARWHHISDLAVTLGPRVHVDAAGVTTDAIRAAARDGGLAGAFTGREHTAPAWIDDHLARTDGLTSADHDLFRVVASGNLGVSRALFERIGRFDESFDQWGGEDTELGYRLFVGGGLLIHDRDARCWHQGEGEAPDAGERLSLVEQRPKLAQLIAHHGFRRVRRGRSYQVPRVAVTVRAHDVDAGAALGSVESVLASNLHDLIVIVDPPVDEQHRRWLERQFEHDVRVAFDAARVAWQTPHRVRLDAPAVVGAESFEGMLAALTEPDDPVGLLNVTVPPARASEQRIVAWNTRAIARVEPAVITDPVLAADPPESALAAVEDVFGRRWMSGTDLAVGEAATIDPLADPGAASGTAAVRGELQAIGEVLARLEPEQQRQLVDVARTGLTQLGPRQLRLLLRVGGRTLKTLAWLRRRLPGGRRR